MKSGNRPCVVFHTAKVGHVARFEEKIKRSYTHGKLFQRTRKSGARKESCSDAVRFRRKEEKCRELVRVLKKASPESRGCAELYVEKRMQPGVSRE